ncbi:uncharacterized protein LOC118613347 [Rousettus aegyptiacus]|uniref:uncharacterized protein LOC118613347 n=1 Tax=Rousettus aegyptiacus TaxID=9407 RepID=UPI00168D6897|nr:uncharacterized protein LOC118613347 [Rousettus aegyptiacus]
MGQQQALAPSVPPPSLAAARGLSANVISWIRDPGPRSEAGASSSHSAGRAHLPAFCPHRRPSAGGRCTKHDPGTGRRRLQDAHSPAPAVFRTLSAHRRPRWLEDWACLGSRASRGSCRSLRRSDQPRPSRRRRGQDSSPHIPRSRGRSGDWTPGDAKAPRPEHQVGCPGSRVPNPPAELTRRLPPGARLSSRRHPHPQHPGSRRAPSRCQPQAQLLL